MPVTIVHSNEATEEPRQEPPTPVTDAATIPPRLAARRDRVSDGVTPAENSSAKSVPPSIPPAVPPPLRPARPKGTTPVFAVTNESNLSQAASASQPRWLMRWLSSQGMIGVGVSLLVHTVVLVVLACFLVSQVSTRDVISIWGVAGETDGAGSELLLDSELPLDAGESAPLQVTDVSQALESVGPRADLAESMRIGLGGHGTGTGDAGDGTSMGVASLRVPGHAQTKGSFSAWADPRDPKPGQEYFIVIQIRLPGHVAKYRGSDVSGNVIGTDGYRQAIRFKSSELLPIENGAVEIRIRVPGAARLVRDTIRVESKILRERQAFEIEF